MSNQTSPRTKKPANHRWWIILLVIVLVVLGAWGVASRIHAEQALKKHTEDTAIPSVSIIEAKSGPEGEDLVLPGNVQAWHEAPIYARTNGYLKSWKVDIGAHVKEGDVLAEIDTPDVDAQMHQADADLSTAIANNQLAQTTAKRWLSLLKTNSVSKQEADEKVGAAAANEAMVAAAKANLDRLRQLEDYRLVVAPFDGVITARNTDVGALINAGSGTGAGQELFHIAETDKLRVYVSVPENYTASIKPDMKADLYFPAYPERSFQAVLARTADAIDPTTRTLLIQLEVDNQKGELMSGGYAEAHIKAQASGDNIRLPVNTLLFRDGNQIATIDDKSKAVLKHITVGRDYGKTVEVLSGLEVGEKVIVNPPDSLSTGQKVKVVSPDEQKKKDAANNNDKTEKNGKDDKQPDQTDANTSNQNSQSQKDDAKKDDQKDSK